MCPKLFRMMNRAIASTPIINLTATPTQFFGTDPCRLRVVTGTAGGAGILFAFGTATPTVYQFVQANGASSRVLGVEDIGQLIQQPIWIWLNTGTLTFHTFTVISALPQDLEAFANGR